MNRDTHGVTLQNTVDFNWPANLYEDFKYMPWSEVVEPDSFPSNAAPWLCVPERTV